MGQDISKVILPSPLTLKDCVIDGRFDITRYLNYPRISDYYIKEDEQMSMNRRKRRRYNSDQGIIKKKIRTPGSVKRHKLFVCDSDDSLHEIRSIDTLWCLMYVDHPPITQWIYKLFRLRFWIPYESFLELSDGICNHHSFVCWTTCGATYNLPSNIKLFLLGPLCDMGRA